MRVILLAVKRQDLYWSVITTIMPRTVKFRNRLAQQKVSANQANSIDYFRVAPSITFKASMSAKFLLWLLVLILT